MRVGVDRRAGAAAVFLDGFCGVFACIMQTLAGACGVEFACHFRAAKLS
jgi:hypothetical protein